MKYLFAFVVLIVLFFIMILAPGYLVTRHYDFQEEIELLQEENVRLQTLLEAAEAGRAFADYRTSIAEQGAVQANNDLNVCRVENDILKQQVRDALANSQQGPAIPEATGGAGPTAPKEEPLTRLENVTMLLLVLVLLAAGWLGATVVYASGGHLS